MDHVVCRNERGKERKFTMQVWNLMKTPGFDGDTRKGWTVIGRPSANGASPTKAGAALVSPQPTFTPKEIAEKQEAEAIAEVQREAALISGEPVVDAAAPVATEATAPAPEAPAAAAEPPAPVESAPATEPVVEVQAEAPAAEVKKDNLGAINGTGDKVVGILNGAGIYTYAQLAAAKTTDINAALEAGGMGPKKAMVPAWKMKAAELAKA